jgi:exodeoxyribonuclease-3
MKIVSWNVNGLRAVHRNGYWEPFLKAIKPDIICFQEVKAEPDQLPDAVRELGGFSAFFSPSKLKKGYSGVALYSRVEPLSVIYGMGISEFDDEGRLIGAEYDDFWLLNIYFPNGGRGPDRLDYKMRYYEAFLAFCKKLQQAKPVIFCGDVNTAHFPIDLARPKENQNNTGFLPIERAWIDELIDSGYVDLFRKFHPNQAETYTYWDTFTHARERNVGWRIDYFFASVEIANSVKKAEVHSQVYGSDHCPISISV